MATRVLLKVIPAAVVILGVAATTAAQTTPPPVPAPATQAEGQAAFPADTKLAFVDLERVFSQSAFGKDGMAKVTALQETLSTGLAVRARDLQALAEKIKTQENLVPQTTLLTWNTDLLRMQREAQFAQQEAQIQVEQFQQTLLGNFEELVRPVIENVRKERGLSFIFALQPAAPDTSSLSLIAADPALDLSDEIARRMGR
jgi:Skp family chaperone for outer membrane proteins